VVELAAVRPTEQDLLAIRKAIEMKELTGSDYIVSDTSFHRVVAEASKTAGISPATGPAFEPGLTDPESLSARSRLLLAVTKTAYLSRFLV